MLDLQRKEKEELILLLKAYDAYIQEANEEDYYGKGWFPVSIEEFYFNEFQEID